MFVGFAVDEPPGIEPRRVVLHHGCPRIRILTRQEHAHVIVVSNDEDRSRLRVPPGHYPRVGECRLWFPGRPPGQQPKSQGCRGIQRIAPAGSWILYRPENDRKVVHARVIDPRRDGVVVVVRVYDVDRGTYLGQERRR